MNKVANEPPMKFSMLSAMDGNDSLKRFERRAAMEEGGPTLGTLVESTDYRVAPSAMYISRARVDKHATKPGAKNRDVSHPMSLCLQILIISRSLRKIRLDRVASAGRI